MAIRLLGNYVIGGGNVGGNFQVPVGATQSFNVPVGGPVTSCWYVPVDNIPDLSHWDHIEVSPSGQAGFITVTLKPNQNSLLRIYVYGE